MKTFLFLFFLNFSIACNFRAHVQSETDHEVFAQFTFHNKSKSEVIKFSSYGEKKNFTITGTICSLAPTILKTWSSDPTNSIESSKPLGETSAHLDGDGDIYYKIFYQDGPAAVRSEGMLCGFGQCRVGK